MEGILYRIKLKKGDFEIEVQGDKEWVENKLNELTAGKGKIASAITSETAGFTETLGEFLDQRGNPQKHTDVAAVYAYWLFKVEKVKLFNVKDIISCYDRTRRTKPGNPSQVINQNVASHIFASSTEKKDGLKAWVITRSGENYVEQMKSGV